MASLEEPREKEEQQKVAPVNGTADSTGKSDDAKENVAETEKKTETETSAETSGETSAADTDSGQKEKGAESSDSSHQENTPDDAEDTDTPSDTAVSDTETTAVGTHRSYTIQPGDTITKISIRNYGNTKKIGEICELNSLSETDLIYPGQKILLP